jgi:1,4-alpha-glucan branching enzyme
MKMKSLLVLIFCVGSIFCFGQKTSVDPVITPALFQPGTTITVTYDVTGTALASLTTAYAWVWIPNKSIDAKYNINPASSNITATNNAKFTKTVQDGKTLFTLTFKPSDFFATSIASESQLGILLKGNDWSNGQTTDYVTNFWDGSFQVLLTSPSLPAFVDNGDALEIKAETPVAADYDLYINNVLIDEADNVASYSYTHTVTEVTGYATVKIVATQGANSSETSFQYIISGNSPTAARPAGIIPGINYKAGDNTKVTLCLWAPGKTSVYALGDFSEWQILPANIMKRDGEYFWIELSGLTSGTEYAYQYLVNESLYLADPYADKILEPSNSGIPASTYPNLKPYPTAALHAEFYFNSVAVFQTGQTPYNWQVTNFEKPAKEKLVVYELLVRDFFGETGRTYKNLIDTIGYFKRLGVNAIELMPIMEFSNNDSWGYNPTFMFAPDKYYGTKNDLKKFVDVCHQNGIAVILDIAMNHHDMNNPYVLMDFDFNTYKPTANNKWFYPTAQHPYNVFYDMNHTSSYTKAYLDTVNYYWLNEYKVDGYRFDLSKGFTGKNYCTTANCDSGPEVNAWSQRDQSRIDILTRMADAMWEHTPDAFIILEHLAVNQEEKELAEYRADEGKGMMLWGNLNYAYNQNTMGYASDSDLSWGYSGSRGWTVPHVVTYMESHDEERLVYKNINFGAVQGNYSVKEAGTAISRIRAANTIFYTIPGPKMLWEFGELGYDYSINTCTDGTVNNNCRVTAKPVRWDYQEDPMRDYLFRHTADIIRLRTTYPLFSTGTATFSGSSTLTKQLTVKSNPYTATPANTNEMNAQIVTNFDLTEKIIPVNFPHTGTWYNYYGDGEAINVTGATANVTLPAGGYALFTDVQITPSFVTDTEDETILAAISLYPNPAKGVIIVKSEQAFVTDLIVRNSQGVRQRVMRLTQDTWDVQHLSTGLYIVELKTNRGIVRKKIVKD